MGRRGEREGRDGMRRFSRLLLGRPGTAGQYDPQPRDVPVTVVAALLLLLLLIAMALL